MYHGVDSSYFNVGAIFDKVPISNTKNKEIKNYGGGLNAGLN